MQVFVINGGFGGWTSSKLQTKGSSTVCSSLTCHNENSTIGATCAQYIFSPQPAPLDLGAKSLAAV